MSHSIENRYIGELRTHSTHLKSSDTIITDAPVDNNGKGNAFSPTDFTNLFVISNDTRLPIKLS